MIYSLLMTLVKLTTTALAFWFRSVILYLLLGIFISFRCLPYRPFDGMERHEMACNMLQRMCAQLVNNKDVEVSVYPEEDIRVINNVSFEIDLLRKNTTGKVSLFCLCNIQPIDVDCDKLTTLMKDLYGRQLFTVDQLVFHLSPPHS